MQALQFFQQITLNKHLYPQQNIFCPTTRRKKEKKAEKAKFFGGTLIAFHIGVAAEYALYQMLNLQSILIVAVPLTAAAVLLAAADGKNQVILHGFNITFLLDLTLPYYTHNTSGYL